MRERRTAKLLEEFNPPADLPDESARLDARSILRFACALSSIGAGLIHLSASRGHREHAYIFVFFLLTGGLQIVWGALALTYRNSRLLYLAGIGNIVIVSIWVASRTSGLKFVEGAEVREHIHAADLIASSLEIVVVLGSVALLLKGGKLRAPLGEPVGERILFFTGAAILALTIFGIVSDQQHVSSHGRHFVHTGASDHGVGSTDHGTDGALHESHQLDEAATHGHSLGPKALGSHGHAASTEGRAQRSITSVEFGVGTLVTVRYGPWVLLPAAMNEATKTSLVVPEVAKPCSDCYITSFKPNLVYEDGSNANLNTGPMLHHAVWRQAGKPDATCGNNTQQSRDQGERFFASGNERTSVSFPKGFGYYVNSSRWQLVLELMNHKQEPKSVYLTLTVTHQPSSSGIKSLTPVWLDINNCRASTYSVPAGPAEITFRWTSNLTGRVISTGGHLHDGGIKTVLAKETADDEMCTSWAGYGRNPEYSGSIESMNTCTWDRLGALRAGETLALTSHYNSPVPQNDVMGINITYIYETADLDGGSAPPASVQAPPPTNQPAPKEHPH